MALNLNGPGSWIKKKIFKKYKNIMIPLFSQNTISYFNDFEIFSFRNFTKRDSYDSYQICLNIYWAMKNGKEPWNNNYFKFLGKVFREYY